jgi:hypothetical protein
MSSLPNPLGQPWFLVNEAEVLQQVKARTSGGQ